MRKKSLQAIINEKVLVSLEKEDFHGIYTFLNPFSYREIRKNECDLSGFSKIGFDGISMCIVWRLLYGRKIERTSFDDTSYARILFEQLNTSGRSLYVIGSKQAHVEQFVIELVNKYPGINIIGSRNGYFHNSEERHESIQQIIRLKPDFIIVGMGTVNQEKYLLELKKAGWSGCGFTCGGFLHQTATGGMTYYPPVIDKLNLRWLFRIVDEPKLAKRYLVDYPAALACMIMDYIKPKF